MTELKTKPTDKGVDEFLKKVEHPIKREDSYKIINLMKEVTKEEPIMWGDSIVGFGSYHYKYASGREGNWFLVGFSPRKQNLTVYLMTGFEKFQGILKDLGKFKTGKSCLYINKLKDINMQKLKELVKESVKHLKLEGS
jgi:hypothetical protein